MILAPFIKKFGKRNLVLAGAILTMVAQLTLLAVPANPRLLPLLLQSAASARPRCSAVYLP